MADLEDRAPRPLILICGMLRTKDPDAFLAAFRGLAKEVLAVSFGGDGARAAEEIEAAALRAGFLASACDDVERALAELATRAWEAPPRILIAGSLHLAGDALARNQGALA